MNARGQSLIELVLFFSALSFLLAGMLGFSRWMSVRLKLLQGAWQGAELYSSGHFTREEVEAQLKRYLTRGSPGLDPAGLRVEIHRLGGIAASLDRLERVTVTYRSPSGWYSLLGADAGVQESCVIKHAPYYGAPFQTLAGPAVSW